MLNEKEKQINTSAMLNIDLIEDLFELSSEKKQELENLYKNAADKFAVGQIISGKVISKDGDGVLVDIEYKSNGLIENQEFSHYELKNIQLESTIDVVIDKLEDEHGTVVLSYQKAKSIKAWDKINDLASADEPVRGLVTHKVKGGLSVDIGIPAFLPGSQVDIQRVNDFDQFVGQEVICKILKINKKRGNVIISRRKFIEEQRLEDKKQALETIEENRIVQGIIKNITNYGAFVDIGGIDGLLHITDMSWGRIAHPSELLKIGDTVTVKIISFDKEHEKISLGMKQLSENPWAKIKDTYQQGKHIQGKISSVTDYGLFVEVEKGIEGLIHISEISWTERITNLNKHFKVNQPIEALIVAVDPENRRMSLSIKQLSNDPWKTITEKFKIGDKIKGNISNITDFGLFIRLANGIDG
ncbi:MAG TPA: S1 RNA-binding domain-containing protein, partial [Candidatus Babeliales bacterium]|nr:S1 RNA-binding domain-containing protein [Candidatus Babeliales bacterium]